MMDRNRKSLAEEVNISHHKNIKDQLLINQRSLKMRVNLFLKLNEISENHAKKKTKFIMVDYDANNF